MFGNKGFIFGVALAVFSVTLSQESRVSCDSDTDCFYVPVSTRRGSFPAMLILHCNGARPATLDSFRLVGDSLGWILASCHASRNHRNMLLNDADVVKTIGKLIRRYPVDSSRIFVFGLSGQGVQALASMFLHPDIVRGVVAVCAHRGALPFAVWETLGNHFAYLVTRTHDWNRAENEMMLWRFNMEGLVTELKTTSGEHGPGSRKELLAGCRWLAAQIKDSE
ncbi:hypothetical protein CH330_07360 [candidate division WOR-3 bacterium JGI_Cruoil_03_51_56]|uniref:Peptidase S9 prolyl oligopeptidase catalytic domain-containing protein n=1 Tax=candidate division WOR-3 bacterium JGI_Cruoil_03_51_56 TaxID=1973747 RepID=A0A235BQV0_UNCW3|nr:MAG: hypothetical protein CH330_07360 [candidate division WOR-3 bacterium JGI_Cruoil_03_51_56]